MKSKIFKLFILAAFISFAAVSFFISGSNTVAKNKHTAILEKVKEYKTWKEVTKPRDTAPGQQPLVVGSPVQIDISSDAG